MSETAPEPALVWCPFPDEASARAAINTLLDENLIACANILGGLVSLFAWKGECDEARETGVLLKTNSLLLDRAVARLGSLHPYEQPAITGWRCDAATPGSRDWLGAIGQ